MSLALRVASIKSLIDKICDDDLGDEDEDDREDALDTITEYIQDKIVELYD